MVRVSVLVPSYNAEKYIEETIKSILSQDFEDLEVIIVNDKSTDNTKKIVENLMKDSSKIKLVDLERNKGRAGAINGGLEVAEGEYITFLDSDDLMAQGRISAEVEFLDKNPEISLVYCNMKVRPIEEEPYIVEAIDFGEKDPLEILKETAKREDLGEIKPAWLLNPYKENKFIPGGTVALRKKILDDIKLDETLRNAEDYDLWLQIIGKGYKIAKIPIIGFIYRQHEAQKSSNKEKMKIAARQINKKLMDGEYFN